MTGWQSCRRNMEVTDRVWLLLLLTETTRLCICAVHGQVIFSCNFDESVACGLREDDDASGFGWRPWRGETDSRPTTGPRADHTFGNDTGTYMYTEASGFYPNSSATLTTPPLDVAVNASADNRQLCVSFWYNMNGIHIGTLTVVRRTSNSSESIWQRRFDQGDLWHEVNISIPINTESISFVAIRGGAYINQVYGDIAIDDIIIYNDTCEQVRSTANPANGMTSLDDTTVTMTSATPGSVTYPVGDGTSPQLLNSTLATTSATVTSQPYLMTSSQNRLNSSSSSLTDASLAATGTTEMAGATSEAPAVTSFIRNSTEVATVAAGSLSTEQSIASSNTSHQLQTPWPFVSSPENVVPTPLPPANLTSITTKLPPVNRTSSVTSGKIPEMYSLWLPLLLTEIVYILQHIV